MKLTTNEILLINEGVLEVKLAKVKLPIGLNFKLTRIGQKTQEVFNTFSVMKDELVIKLGTPIEGKENQFNFTETNGKLFSEAIQELLDVEQEIDIHPIDIKQFNSAEMTLELYLKLKSIVSGTEDL